MAGESEEREAKPFPEDGASRITQVHNYIRYLNAPDSVVGSALDAAQSATRGTVRATGRLDRTEVRATLKGYIAPGCHEAAARHLRDQQIVVLEGRHGLGKRTGALSLLDEVTEESLVELTPTGTLRSLAEFPYKQGYGYLVSGHQDVGDPADREFTWLAVRAQVSEAEAFLVVTINREPGRYGSEHVHQVAWQPPDATAYLAQHLPQDAVGEIVAELDGFYAMTDLARIAAHHDVTSALADLRASSIVPVREWFAEPKPRESILDLAALSFLAGTGERVFERLREQLSALLAEQMPEPGESGPQDGETALHRGRGRRVVEDGLVDRLKNSAGRIVLDFAVPTYRAEVLAQLSEWYASPFWDALKIWLERIVESGDEELRTTVAEGLALLAAANWDEVETSYLEPWSRYELDWAGQETATFLMWLMSCDEQLAPATLRTATRWSGSPSTWQRWTAAIVFSGVLGLRYPTEAVRRLWSITVHGNELAEDATFALAGLFSALVAREESVDPVLNLLEMRLKEYGRVGADRRLQRLAMTAILAVLSVRDPGGRRPTVVTLLSDRPEASPRIARLWAETLRHRPFRLRAMDTLADALEALGEDGEPGKEIAFTLCADLASALPSHEHPHLNREFTARQTRFSRPGAGSLGDVLRAALAQDLKEESS
jgi:hypothetical protein